MKKLKKLILKNNFFFNWLSFFKFSFLLLNNNIFFLCYKKILILYIKFFYIVKSNTAFIFLLLLKKNKRIKNFSFLLLQKLKSNLNTILSKSRSILILRGRGFRLISFTNSIIKLKLGFTHNIALKLNNFLYFKILTKNGQKFQITGSLIQIIQVISCLNFIKKKNVFTSKGIFFNTEKIKNKKSTKTAW